MFKNIFLSGYIDSFIHTYKCLHRNISKSSKVHDNRVAVTIANTEDGEEITNGHSPSEPILVRGLGGDDGGDGGEGDLLRGAARGHAGAGVAVLGRAAHCALQRSRVGGPGVDT